LRRRKAAARKLVWRWTVVGLVLLVLVITLLGFAFAGSSDRISTGVKIAGVDVGGMKPAQARALLERRSARLQHARVVFLSGGHRWEITPARLGIRIDWGAAVEAAQGRGDGFGPFRGLRRLEVRVFGAQVSPPVHAWNTAVDYQLSLFAREIDRSHRDAALKLHGLKVAVVPGQDGRVLDRKAAAGVLLHALQAVEDDQVRPPVAQPTLEPFQTPPGRALFLAEEEVIALAQEGIGVGMFVE